MLVDRLSRRLLPGARFSPNAIPPALLDPVAILDKLHHSHLCLDDDPALGGVSRFNPDGITYYQSSLKPALYTDSRYDRHGL